MEGLAGCLAVLECLAGCTPLKLHYILSSAMAILSAWLFMGFD